MKGLDMTPSTDPNIYDEDSVFNRLLSPDKPKRRISSSQRLSNIFAEAPAKAETINVSDFLPQI